MKVSRLIDALADLVSSVMEAIGDIFRELLDLLTPSAESVTVKWRIEKTLEENDQYDLLILSREWYATLMDHRAFDASEKTLEEIRDAPIASSDALYINDVAITFSDSVDDALLVDSSAL